MVPSLVDTFDHQFAGWTVIEKLGQGGMCMVYRAHRTGDPDDQHALKVLIDHDVSARRRFLDEGTILVGLDHTNLLTVQEVHDDDPPWIVMELLAGKDLEALRDSSDAFSPEVVARWIADVAQGLQRCHDHGVVHRDIKPSNVMLGRDGTPRLIDFGVARKTGEAHKTRAGVVMGTVSYLPPEVFLESRVGLQDDPAADVYALGQTLVELLIGRPIHRREDVDGPHMLVAVMRDKVSRPHLDPREWNDFVPDELAEIAIAATAQEPEDRIRTAADLEQRLRQWSAGRRTGAIAPVSMPPTSMPTLPTERPAVPRETVPPARPIEEEPLPSHPALSGGPTPTNDPLVPPLAMGAGAVGLISIGIGAVAAVVGLALLGLWAGRTDPATQQAQAAVQQRFAADALPLRRCVSTQTNLVLEMKVTSGRIARVVGDGLPATVSSCIEDVTRAWTLDTPDASVQIELLLSPL